MRVAFHPLARAEYREAAAFYEQRRAGIGARFTLEVESVLSRISESPERWRLVEQDVRRCLARRFPYGVFYTIEPNFVLVVAVAHSHRKPGYWRERLPDAEASA